VRDPTATLNGRARALRRLTRVPRAAGANSSDEVIAPFTDTLGVLGSVGAVLDPSNLTFDVEGFRATLRVGRSDRNLGARDFSTVKKGVGRGETEAHIRGW
jgi:hypothetical protein